ncbi:MAG: hypothetical protein IPK75_00460 [Acidobacteria bacterium]|nr:hypothetical protein [Acidobacteriota bacterium]
MLLLALAAAAFGATPAIAKPAGRAEIHVNVTDNDGARQYCAGETVFALPVNDRSTDVIESVYGSTETGFASIYATPELIIRRRGTDYVGGTSPDATKLFRRTFKGQKRGKCDDLDVATFEDLKAGAWYLIIPVFWQDDTIPGRLRDVVLQGGGRNDIYVKIPINYRGGTFLVRTEIGAGETTAFILENQMVDPAPE